MTDPTDESDPLADAYEEALALEKAREPGAAAAWRKVLALNAADPGGAALRLAALGAGAAPDRAPAAYVATLFDQHAEVFESILVDQLGYDAPTMIRARAQALALGPFARMLDLGCGTGLAAEALEDVTTHRTGVDLAEGMIEIAGEKEIYDDLFVADVCVFLEDALTRGLTWDVIVAADVLPYLGDARPLVRAVAAAADPRAVFAFSTETLPAEALAGRDWTVTPHHRYAHDRAYVMRELESADFSVIEAEPIMVRRESGAPIGGHLFIARRGT